MRPQRIAAEYACIGWHSWPKTTRFNEAAANRCGIRKRGRIKRAAMFSASMRPQRIAAEYRAALDRARQSKTRLQ